MMRQRRVAFHFVWIGLLLVTVAGVAAHAGRAAASAPDAALTAAPASDVAASGIAAPAVASPADASTLDLSTCDGPAAEEFTPVACKMEPQCSTNADCFAWCGPSGGHCVHSSCPIRICKCS